MKIKLNFPPKIISNYVKSYAKAAQKGMKNEAERALWDDIVTIIGLGESIIKVNEK